MSRAKKLAFLIADIAALYGALAVALLLRYPGTAFEAKWGDHVAPFSFLFIVWVLIFWLLDLYRQRAFVNYNALATRIMTATGIAFVSSIVLFYLLAPVFELTPKTNLVLFSVLFALIDYLLRATAINLVRRNALPIILIGNSHRVEELSRYLKENRHAGYEVAKWIPTLGERELATLPETLRATHSTLLVVQPSLAKDPAAISGLYKLLAGGATIINFSDFYEMVFERVPLEELEESWFLEHVTTRRPVYDRAKRLLDVALALSLLLFLAPLTIAIGFLVLLTSGMPVIYRQKRVGKNDREFTLYKFRTMTHENGGPLWTEKGDTRVTWFGKLLRGSHLDELPQLWNIAAGNLSFAGPRPERTELVAQFRQFPYYGIRHLVQPGLTGWAQINYRPSASLEEAKEKLAYDVYYVKNRSFLLDLAIFLKTIKYVFVSPE